MHPRRAWNKQTKTLTQFIHQKHSAQRFFTNRCTQLPKMTQLTFENSGSLLKHDSFNQTILRCHRQLLMKNSS